MKHKSFSLTAVTSAFLASLCCVGPAVLTLIGVGGTAWWIALDAYRPYFIMLTVLLLGTAFYFAYRPAKRCADGSCELPSRTGRGVLWTAALLSVIFIVYPYVGFSQENKTRSVESTAVTIPVQGMTCEGCEKNVEKAVADIPGVQSARANHKKAQVEIWIDSTLVTSSIIVETINTRTSYRARLTVHE